MYQLPRTVGPLTIERRQGTDGVTDAWRGTWQSDADRPVLARRLLDWVVQDQDVLYAVEARIGDLRELRHPRLVRILDYLRAGDERYIVEEAVRGVDLMHLIHEVHSTGGSIPPHVFLHIAIQICTNLEALHHNRGAVTGEDPMLHRAIRPSAVYVSVEGSVRLGGYGLLPSHNLIPANVFRGTVRDRTAFLAPEQVDDGREISKATDIFSMGGLLFTMLTGEVMFDAPSDLQAVFQIRQADTEKDLASTRRLVPGIDQVLRRCLYAMPGRRYQSVTMLREDLRQLASHHDMSRITEDILDLLAGIGVEPPSRSPQRSPAPRAETLEPVDDDADEPTAQDAHPVDHGIDGELDDEDATADGSRTDPELTRPVGLGAHGMGHAAAASAPLPLVYDLLSDDEDDLDEVTSADLESLDGEEGFEDSSYLPETTHERPIPVVTEPSSTLRGAAPSRGPKAGPAYGAAPMRASGADLATGQAARHGHRETTPPVIERTARSKAVRVEQTGRQPQLPPAPPTWVPPANTSPALAATPVPVPPPHGEVGANGPFADDDVAEMPIGRFVVGGAAALFCAFLIGVTSSSWLDGRNDAATVAAAAPAASAARASAPAAVSTPVTQQAALPGAPSTASLAAPNGSAVVTTGPLPLVVQGDGATAPRVADPNAPAPTDPAAALRQPDPRARGLLAAPGGVTAPTATPAPQAVVANARAVDGMDAAARIRSLDAPEAVAASTARTDTQLVSASAGLVASAATDTAWEPPKRIVDSTLGERASKGRLTADDRSYLEGIETTHPDFNKARVWLYDDATARSSLAERKRHIDALMRLPENTYNPVYLTEAAGVAIAYKDYDGALALARKAEQHWARLPSQAVFNRKAMIYEQQAASWYGMFVTSDGKNPDALDQAIRAWQRYRQHVSTRDANLAARADDQIARLTDIGQRVQ